MSSSFRYDCRQSARCGNANGEGTQKFGCPRDGTCCELTEADGAGAEAEVEVEAGLGVGVGVGVTDNATVYIAEWLGLVISSIAAATDAEAV